MTDWWDSSLANCFSKQVGGREIGEFTVQLILNNTKIANWWIKVWRISSIRQTKVPPNFHLLQYDRLNTRGSHYQYFCRIICDQDQIDKNMPWSLDFTWKLALILDNYCKFSYSKISRTSWSLDSVKILLLITWFNVNSTLDRLILIPVANGSTGLFMLLVVTNSLRSQTFYSFTLEREEFPPPHTKRKKGSGYARQSDYPLKYIYDWRYLEEGRACIPVGLKL